MLSQQLEESIRAALIAARQTGSFLSDEILIATKVERGDFASAIALKLATKKNISANTLAQAIASSIDSDLLAKVEVDNGFINLTVSKYALSLVVHSALTSPLLPRGINNEMPSEWLYAGHRLSAALRQLTEPRLNLLEQKLLSPVLEAHQFQNIEKLYLADMSYLESAFDEEIVGTQLASDNKKLALLLDCFLENYAESSENSAALNGDLNAYIDGLSRQITRFHILDCLAAASRCEKIARIGLISAAKRVFGACLGILNLAVQEKL